MDIRYSVVAENALIQIEDYYAKFSKNSCENVLEDIHSVIKLLESQPEIGRLHASKAYRLFPTTKYGFMIVYRLDAEYVSILDIYRFQNRDYS